MRCLARGVYEAVVTEFKGHKMDVTQLKHFLQVAMVRQGER